MAAYLNFLMKVILYKFAAATWWDDVGRWQTGLPPHSSEVSHHSGALFTDVRADAPHVRRDAGAGSSAPGIPDNWAEVLGDGRGSKSAGSSRPTPAKESPGAWRGWGGDNEWSRGWGSSSWHGTRPDERNREDAGSSDGGWEKHHEYKWDSWSESSYP